MAHFTANDTSTDEAVEYAGIEGVAEIKLDAMLRDAERLVAHYAPPPDPITEAYTSAAKDGEMRVFEYLATTEGYLTSGGIAGISENYVSFDHVERIVRRTVGAFAGESADVAYIERFWPAKPLENGTSAAHRLDYCASGSVGTTTTDSSGEMTTRTRFTGGGIVELYIPGIVRGVR